ncbi:MAG: DsrE family protein [Clostridia bacterium]
MRKFAIFVYNGDQMCFMHAMLNVLNLSDKGYEATLIIEGEAVKLVEKMQKNNTLFKQLEENNLVYGVCKACSAKFGVLEYNEKSGLALLDDMEGHPSMSQFIEKEYEIISM